MIAFRKLYSPTVIKVVWWLTVILAALFLIVSEYFGIRLWSIALGVGQEQRRRPRPRCRSRPRSHSRPKSRSPLMSRSQPRTLWACSASSRDGSHSSLWESLWQ